MMLLSYNKFDAYGVSIFSLKKHAFVNRAFSLMLVFRKQSMQMQEFFQMLQRLVATCCIGIIAGGLNYDLLKVLENKLLDIFTGRVQMVNKSTHISGSLIDYVYIKKSLTEEFFTNANVENIYFSDDYSVRILTEK